ncbi:acetoacetate decarboxylase family protein [Rhodococcus koreensis]
MSKADVHAADEPVGRSVLNLMGVRPGKAFAYEQKAMPSVIHFDIQFESTYDAIEQLVLPPPLKCDRREPPIVNVSYFTNAECYAMDGRNTPYQAVMLTARTQWGDRQGVAGWEFVDGLHGDKTEMDIMGPWGLHFGMLKKFADIRVSHTAADEFNVEVKRRGKVLVKMGLRTGDAVDAAELEAFNKASLGVFGVREFPNVDYTGYIERSIVVSEPVTDDRVARAWHADAGFVEFDSGELDPLGDLPVLSIAGALVYDSSSRKEHFAARHVVADLLDEQLAPPAAADDKLTADL